jgi:hypothetical protein
MGVLLDKWRNAKLLFKTTANVKKPSPKVGTFASKTLGIEKALIKLEAAQAKDINTNVKALADWKKAGLEFRIVKTNYMVVLEGAIGKEPAGADRDLYRKGIAMLKTQLNSLDSTIKVATTAADSRHANHNGQQFAAAKLMDDVKKGCHDAEAFIALVRLDPTPAKFNAGIMTAARDITQNAANINALTNLGFQFPKAQPTALINVLTPWANSVRDLPDDATPAKVLSELKVFEKVVQGVNAWAA